MHTGRILKKVASESPFWETLSGFINFFSLLDFEKNKLTFKPPFAKFVFSSEKLCKGLKNASVLFILLILIGTIGCQPKPEETPPKTEVKVWPQDFVIALIPEQNIFTQKKRYQPICDYLSKKLQINVKTKILESYELIYKQMRDKRVDAGFFGSFNYTLTHHKLGIIPLVRPVWNNGESTYAGYIFTRKSSGISADIKDWQGKTLALVHPYTTAGYFFPRWHLFERGIDKLNSYFKNVIFTGSHDAAVLAVFNQEAEIGAAKNHIYNKMIKENPEMEEALKILAESKTVPSNGLAVRKDIPKSIQDKLEYVLLNMDKDQNGKFILKNFGAIKFIKTTNKDYDPVREMIAPLNVDLNKFEPAKARHKYLGEINAN